MTFVSQSMWRRDRCDNRRMRSRAVSHLDGAELQRERYRYLSNWGEVKSVEYHYRLLSSHCLSDIVRPPQAGR